VNIFALDQNPQAAATMLTDVHKVKMVLEAAQMLCGVFEPGIAPYKRTHYNHPCSVWARTSRRNFDWLVAHGLAIAAEYTKRYGKVHKSQAVIEWCRDNAHLLTFPRSSLTPFAQAMPDQYRQADSVAAYRAYYAAEKQH
jgi:hypothetical protein